MPVTLPALKTELQTDPQNYGYAPFVAIRNDTVLALLINFKPRDGVTLPPFGNVGPAVQVKRGNVPPVEILEAIDVRDFLASPAGVNSIPLAQSWLESITQYSTIRLANADGTKTQVRKNIDRLVGDAQGSQTRLDAVAVRFGSRAEQLFGENSVVSVQNVSDALNS